MNRQKRFRSIVAIMFALALGLSLAACNKPSAPAAPPETEEVTVAIAAAPSTIRYGTTVKLNVTVTGTTDARYVWSTTNDDVIEVSTADIVSVKRNVSVDTVVTVTATSAADPTAKASHTFTVKPAIAGQVGDLTADMIEAISGPNITVTGTVSDIFDDRQTSSNSETSTYNVTVKMNDGKWYGKWGKVVGGNVENELEDNYIKGGETGTGEHLWIRRYVGINNEVVSEVQRGSNYKPVTWESGRLWNQLGGLGADISNKFLQRLDIDEKTYEYQIDWTPVGNAEYSDDAWLMTYLPVSLTPMMSETFAHFYLIVENGAVTQIIAQTDIEAPTDSNDEVLYNSYTEVRLTISDVGTTEVPEPAAYEAPSRYGEVLTEAIGKMQTAKNYTFAASDTSVKAPVVDDSDYSYESLSASSSPAVRTISSIAPIAEPAPTVTGPFRGHDSATSSKKLDGGLGTMGYVTEDIVLLEEWGEYSAYMDNPYYVRYSGYKQFGEGEDKYFEFFSDGNGQVGDKPAYLKGYKHYAGDMWEKKLPQWNISANIFDYKSSGTVYVNGQLHDVYKFELRDSAVTAAVTKQIACDGKADNGYPAAFKKLTISVDSETHDVVEIVYPYDITVGTYTGYVTIQIYNVGTTALRAADFEGENYIEREVKNEWSQYSVMYYDPNHDDKDVEATADAVFNRCYDNGAAAALPKPKVFMDVMGGDNIGGPFFDWTAIKNGEDQITGYKESVEFNIRMEEEVWNTFFEESADPEAYGIEAILGKDGTLTKAICTEGSGWSYSRNDSGWRTEGGDFYYGTYTNTDSGIMLVVENNATRNFFCYVYKLGDWKLH